MRFIKLPSIGTAFIKVNELGKCYYLEWSGREVISGCNFISQQRGLQKQRGRLTVRELHFCNLRRTLR